MSTMDEYDPKEIYNMDSDIRAVLTQLVDGTILPGKSGIVP